MVAAETSRRTIVLAVEKPEAFLQDHVAGVGELPAGLVGAVTEAFDGRHACSSGDAGREVSASAPAPVAATILSAAASASGRAPSPQGTSAGRIRVATPPGGPCAAATTGRRPGPRCSSVAAGPPDMRRSRQRGPWPRLRRGRGRHACRGRRRRRRRNASPTCPGWRSRRRFRRPTSVRRSARAPFTGPARAPERRPGAVRRARRRHRAGGPPCRIDVLRPPRGPNGCRAPAGPPRGRTARFRSYRRTG